MKNRSRSIEYKVYVNEEENLMIKERMVKVNIQNKSDYARKMMIDGYIIVTDFSPIKELSTQISKVGNNINQIARVINATKTVEQSEIVELKKLLSEIYLKQEETLKLLMKPLKKK